MTLKQFCFKSGLYVDDAFKAIYNYAVKFKHIFIERNRRLWPNSLFENLNTQSIKLIDSQKMIVTRKCYDLMYEESNEEILYTMYDSGIEVLEVLP